MSKQDGLQRCRTVVAVLSFGMALSIATGGVPVESQPLPGASASAPASFVPSTSAASVLAAFGEAWAQVQAYSTTIDVLERKGDQVQKVTFQYNFAKPSTARVRVAAGPNAGAILTWDGGPNVVVQRGTGLLALFKKTLSLHGAQVTTIRGSSIDQLSFGAILVHAQDQTGKLSEAKSDADGSADDAVTLVPSGTMTDAGLTREVVEISRLSHLPVRVLGYEGAALVREISFTATTLH